MNRLKTKASQFFQNALSQDEHAANASTDYDAEFDAGIERRLRKKPSRFFRRKDDKPLPAPPPDTATCIGGPRFDAGVPQVVAVDKVLASTLTETDKSLPDMPPATKDASDTETQALENDVRGKSRKAKPPDLVLKSRPSFSSLRSVSSRIFRTNTYDHDPPPPPMPQIPIETPTPQARRPTIQPGRSARSARRSRPGSGRALSISRPLSCAQPPNIPSIPLPSTVPFTKPTGPPPPRPPRPASLDSETLALMRDGSARLVLNTPTRIRSPTTTTTTSSSSGHHSASTRVCSEEATTRLGLPSGHSSLSTPRSAVFDSPLTASFSVGSIRFGPVRESSRSATRYSRSSAYISACIKARPGYGSGVYADGVEREDRDLGPIEQFQEGRCADWVLERRVCGGMGERGMMFRDGRGGWHFVGDV